MAEPLQLKDHSSEAQIFALRLAVAAVVVVVLMGVLAAWYYKLQVTQYEEYATVSDRNRMLVQPLPPNRGLIFDRNGELLAENRASFKLSLVKERVPNLDDTLTLLSTIVEVTESDLERFHSSLERRRRPFEAVPLRLNLSEAERARLAVNEYRLEGVQVDAQLVRHYPYSELFAHSVGYVGRINDQELNSFDEERYKAYQGTDTIGKIGLEKQYEDYLLGTVGYQQVEKNAHGRVLRVIAQEHQSPMPGKDLHLYLDLRVQQVAATAMEGKRGAVVAIDPRNGGVLAMVSTPSFDPNLFVTGISYKDFKLLNESPDAPQINRAVQGRYSPGSTIKPMLGLAGLHYGFINESTTINDPGFYKLDGVERIKKDWNFSRGGHGKAVDIIEAIEESCNTFFWDLSFRMGIDKMHQFGSLFGLGDYTGIDIPNETRGIWPSREWKQGARGEKWYDGDTLNVAVGQGDVTTTPLQLAVMTATIASRGKHRRPSLVKLQNGVPATDGEVTETELLNVITTAPQHWNTILTGMEKVVHSARGTASQHVKPDGYRMAAKTGTAQVFTVALGEKYKEEELDARLHDQALFVAFAPAENPTIAVAVMVENGKHGGWEAPVAQAVMDEFFAVEKELEKQLQDESLHNDAKLTQVGSP